VEPPLGPLRERREGALSLDCRSSRDTKVRLEASEEAVNLETSDNHSGSSIVE
jgi:hypothetical protein